MTTTMSTAEKFDILDNLFYKIHQTYKNTESLVIHSCYQEALNHLNETHLPFVFYQENMTFLTNPTNEHIKFICDYGNYSIKNTNSHPICLHSNIQNLSFTIEPQEECFIYMGYNQLCNHCELKTDSFAVPIDGYNSIVKLTLNQYSVVRFVLNDYYYDIMKQVNQCVSIDDKYYVVKSNSRRDYEEYDKTCDLYEIDKPDDTYYIYKNYDDYCHPILK